MQADYTSEDGVVKDLKQANVAVNKSSSGIMFASLGAGGIPESASSGNMMKSAAAGRGEGKGPGGKRLMTS